MNIQYRIFITMTCHPEDTSEGSAKLIEGKEKLMLVSGLIALLGNRIIKQGFCVAFRTRGTERCEMFICDLMPSRIHFLRVESYQIFYVDLFLKIDSIL